MGELAVNAPSMMDLWYYGEMMDDLNNDLRGRYYLIAPDIAF